MGGLELLSTTVNDSAFSIINGVSDELIPYLETIGKTKQKHMVLIIIPFEKISEVSKITQIKGLSLKSDIHIVYEKYKRDGIKSNTELALLLTNTCGAKINFEKASWVNPEIQKPTNLWCVSPNDSFVSLREPYREIPFNAVCFDVIAIMQSLSYPLPVSRWTYIGPKNLSVESYSKNVLPCNIYTINTEG